MWRKGVGRRRKTPVHYFFLFGAHITHGHGSGLQVAGSNFPLQGGGGGGFGSLVREGGGVSGVKNENFRFKV